MKKKHIRRIIDVAMTILLPLLMAYSLIGEAFHEIIGSGMLVLFILHHILNRKWYPALGRGRYSARRVTQIVLDAALLVIMVLQPVSGILISKHLFTFIHVQGAAATARELHLCLAYWGFALMCLHAGMHLAIPVQRMCRAGKQTRVGLHAAWIAAAVYGCTAFARRGIAAYMLRQTAFAFIDTTEPKLHFFADYLAMMLLFLLVGYGIARATDRKHEEKKT